MSKTERQATVETLAAQIKGSPNVYVTDFQGLNVARMTDLRRSLRVAGAKYVVPSRSNLALIKSFSDLAICALACDSVASAARNSL